MPDERGHVVLLGATGSIGRACCAELLAQGYRVTCLTRKAADDLPVGTAQRVVDFTAPDLRELAPISAVFSCMASRSGSARDAWAVDHAAQRAALRASVDAGAGQFILLSAICVQKPLLEFQRAKLAFEAELQAAPIGWSIVRPTAFFKSLSGQVARVQAGKPFLVFGDGRLTACKPISDRDLARYLVGCISAPDRQGRVLPVGGPGPAISPRDQAEMLAELLGRPVRTRQVPVALMDAIIATLSALGRVAPRMAERAEFARIGRYYATESMLVWDVARGAYDADATPEFGTDTLRDHYRRLLAGEDRHDLGAHAVF